MINSKVLITGGCSFSDPNNKTWPTYFTNKYNFDYYLHTGVGASGNTMITHRLMHSINTSLEFGFENITLAVMWSETERNDIFTNDWSLDMNTDNGNILFNNNITTNLEHNANFKITSGFIRPGRIPDNAEYYRNEIQRKWLLDYYKFYNEEYSIMNTLKNILLIQNVCKQKNIKCIMFVMKNIFENIDKYPQLNYLYNMVDWDMFLFYEKKYGLYEYTAINDLEFWEDNFHPDFSAHKSFIDYFDKDIKKVC